MILASSVAGFGTKVSGTVIDFLAAGPLRVNVRMTPAEEEAEQRCVRRGQPFVADPWQKRTAPRLGLKSTFRPRGRATRKPNNGT